MDFKLLTQRGENVLFVLPSKNNSHYTAQISKENIKMELKKEVYCIELISGTPSGRIIKLKELPCINPQEIIMDTLSNDIEEIIQKELNLNVFQPKKFLSPGNIKKRLIDKGLSITDLAKKMGISRTFVSLVIHGHKKSIPTLKKISKILNF